MPRLILVLLAIFLATAPIRAQTTADSKVTISTDRPAVTNSSVVVPVGGLQVENGFLATNAQGQSSIDFTETAIRYGLLQKTELRLGVPDYFYNLPSGNVTNYGFGDLALGLKQQLGPFHGFDISAICFLSLPTGAREISSDGYDPGLQFPWSRSLSKNWTAGGQVAFYWPTVTWKHNFTGEATFFFDRQLSGSWDAFVEYAGDFPQRGGSRQFPHFGTAYRFTHRQQIGIPPALSVAEGNAVAIFCERSRSERPHN